MIDFKEIQLEGELWELFARDFLVKCGFYIESSVDRGPDGKKDLIVSEQLKGNLSNYKLKWLVSCKHFANRASSNSVKEEDEPNILERVKDFKCDGFIGFYSTVPSSGLNTRLNRLKENGDIKDYRIFDYKLIENTLISLGYSELLMRYFPISYKKIKPLHLLFDKYLPLHCKYCNEDLLQKAYNKEKIGIIVMTSKYTSDDDDNGIIDKVYWVCKGDCDSKLGRRGSWEDIDDIIMPAKYVDWILNIMNQLQIGSDKYTTSAYQSLNYFIRAISQKVVREMTNEEKQWLTILNKMPYF